MDYGDVIEGLLAEYDLNKETGRNKAYARCEGYADEHIHGRVEYNTFMEAVAVRLQMPATRRNRLDGDLGEASENAKIHLRYAPRSGPELTANAEGLRYLASICGELAEHAIESDHIHLYPGEEPMQGKTYPLTIYHEPDAWFEKLESGADENPEESATAERDIQPGEIGALCLLAEVPPDMPLTKHRLYRVLSVEPHDGRDVWEKQIRETRDRLFLFTLATGDSGSIVFGFDLDDPAVLFFTHQDVERCCGIG